MVECGLRVAEEVTMVRVVNFMAVRLGMVWLVSVVHVVWLMVRSVHFVGVRLYCMNVMRVVFGDMMV